MQTGARTGSGFRKLQGASLGIVYHKNIPNLHSCFCFVISTTFIGALREVISEEKQRKLNFLRASNSMDDEAKSGF